MLKGQSVGFRSCDLFSVLRAAKMKTDRSEATAYEKKKKKASGNFVRAAAPILRHKVCFEIVLARWWLQMWARNFLCPKLHVVTMQAHLYFYILNSVTVAKSSLLKLRTELSEVKSGENTE